MKTKNFHDYLKTRLTDEEITEIEQEAQREVGILRSIHKILTDAMAERLKQDKVPPENIAEEPKSTLDIFLASLSPGEHKKFNEEYLELLLSELILAAMAKDDTSVRKLGERVGIPQTIVQAICNSMERN